VIKHLNLVFKKNVEEAKELIEQRDIGGLTDMFIYFKHASAGLV
jgi:hypothetical protein